MSLHSDAAAGQPAPTQSGWKLPPSPWDTPIPGMNHKRAPFKPTPQIPWPAATIFAEATSTEANPETMNQANNAEHQVRTSVAVDATGCVVADLICRRCGYALRGLHAAGKCPECGVDIAESLKSDQLIHADLIWLTAVASGLRWCWILALAGWLGAIAGFGLEATGLVGGTSGNVLDVLIGAPIIFAKLVMWWRWTKPERMADGIAVAAAGRAEGFTARKATRLFAMISLAVLCLETLAPLMGLHTVPRSFGGLGQVTALSFGAVVSVLAVAKYAALAACFFATCIYLKQLARRANDPTLLGYCQVAMIVAPVLAITLGCVIIGLVVAWFMWWAMLISAETTISSIVRARTAAERLAAYSAPA